MRLGKSCLLRFALSDDVVKVAIFEIVHLPVWRVDFSFFLLGGTNVSKSRMA